MKPARPVVLLLGPSRAALSGVATHLNLLIESSLGSVFELAHFQVGSEGRAEGWLGRLWRIATSPLALAAAIAGRRASIVHLNTSLNPRAYWRDLAYLLTAKLCGARIVYQVHGGELPQRFLGTGRLGAAFLRATLKLPDAIVVLASEELEAYRAFVPGQAIAMLPNGVDCTQYARQARVCTHPTRPLELLYVGRIAAEKGLYEALKGLSLARAKGVCARLIVAGGGPERTRLERYAQELGMADHVWFPGPVAGERKAHLFRHADALVLPSYSEGLPYALLEGMAAGATPIATPVGAIADVVADGVHGLLVPPRNADAIAAAIGRLAADRACLARMSVACRKRIASAYSIERLAAELGSLYSELGAARALKALRGG